MFFLPHQSGVWTSIIYIKKLFKKKKKVLAIALKKIDVGRTFSLLLRFFELGQLIKVLRSSEKSFFDTNDVSLYSI